MWSAIYLLSGQQMFPGTGPIPDFRKVFRVLHDFERRICVRFVVKKVPVGTEGEEPPIPSIFGENTVTYYLSNTIYKLPIFGFVLN